MEYEDAGGYEDEEEILSPEDIMLEYEDYDPEFYTDLGPMMGGDGGGGLAPFSFEDILKHCLEPTVKDGLQHVGKVILWCVVFRIITQSNTGNGPPSRNAHLASVLIGLVVLAHFFYTNVVYIVACAALSYATLWITHNKVGKNRGLTVSLTCVSFNLVCELLVASPPDWHMIRGAQMILVMKAVSLAFDMDEAAPTDPTSETSTANEGKDQGESSEKSHQYTKKGSNLRQRRGGKYSDRRYQSEGGDDSAAESTDFSVPDLTKIPSVPEFFGYALCPGTVVFGPWVKYSDYFGIFVQPRWNATWFVKIVFTMAFSFMFLTISTCWNPWLIPDDNWRWWIAYRDAMSFRASHYFVSYVGEASAVAAGFGASSKEGAPITKSSSTGGVIGGGGVVHWNGVQITQPHNIEVPRSLLDVVVSWNIPMHKWLKTYCFKTTLRRYGSGGLAVFVTYAASTLLHGLNFQLGAVLFSLGFYTYTEHTLRKKLAALFDASIEAKRCPDTVHRHKEGRFLVILANMFFGLLACFHLAYLGVMFNQQEDIMAEGYSWRHTLAKWDALGFKSHWVIMFTFVLTLVLP